MNPALPTSTAAGSLDMTAGPTIARARKCSEYGKHSELTGADREHQEISMLALHLLQAALVHVNTLLVQQVLTDETWAARMGEADRRGLSALFWTNVNAYGRFTLQMDDHLDLDLAEAA